MYAVGQIGLLENPAEDPPLYEFKKGYRLFDDAGILAFAGDFTAFVFFRIPHEVCDEAKEFRADSKPVGEHAEREVDFHLCGEEKEFFLLPSYFLREPGSPDAFVFGPIKGLPRAERLIDSAEAVTFFFPAGKESYEIHA